MSWAEIKKDAENKMQRAFDSFKQELSKIRAGRASVGFLDHVMVDYYQDRTPLPQVARVSLLDANTLMVTPWEKSWIAAIGKAIREAGLGLNPVEQSDGLRVPMPLLTKERRAELSKQAKQLAEAAKVAVRSARRQSNEQLRDSFKRKELSEDEERRAQDSVQKITDRFVDLVEHTVEVKEQELMTL